MPQFVGRVDALSRLTAALAAAATQGRVALALVAGEAGMGKTALLDRFADLASQGGARAVRGTCWDADLAPAFWPWTQALRTLVDARPAAAADLAAADLAPVLPTDAQPRAQMDDPSGRVRVFDAVARFLATEAAAGPLVVMIDDAQWADASTMDLLRFLAMHSSPAALLLVVAYRDDELGVDAAATLADLAPKAESVRLRGLDPPEVTELVREVAGDQASMRWAAAVHERSSGHPFFARELAHVLTSGGAVGGVPTAVAQVIARRLARLSPRCADLVDAAAVAGANLLPDVLADAAGLTASQVSQWVDEAVAAGVFVVSEADDGAIRFVHDLYRETRYAQLTAAQRVALHHRIGLALQRRHERGAATFPAEPARHFAMAVQVAGVGPALTWARRAADAERGRFAFAEAAGHLARVRSATERAGESIGDKELVTLIVTEARDRLGAGDAGAARRLLDEAWGRAIDAEQLGMVALGLDRLGARFAMPRAELIDALEQARTALEQARTGLDGAAERRALAQVTAALARQLQHSVPRDRPRAGPLAEQAVAIARTLHDPATLASCLLAQHDIAWTPGTGPQRVTIAREIVELARAAGDAERESQGLLLAANALLETGSPAFRAALHEYNYVTARLRQPRQEYLLRTRAAAIAVLDGDLTEGERLSEEAAAAGAAIGEVDTGNVRMSQRLEIVRAGGDPTRLAEMAAEAVRWWVGVPVHAHAVAAGFLARAGDLEGAQRELDVVLALDDWRADRSYLWSVFVGELTAAAVALENRPLCTELLDALLPVADSCAVNGALVCFMGSHAHRVGLLYGALGQREPARSWLAEALRVHQRLGSALWVAESRAALAALDSPIAGSRSVRSALTPGSVPGRTPGGEDQPVLQRVGDVWEASYRGSFALLRDAKGLHDLAVLLARPGREVSALELVGAGLADHDDGGARLDRTALSAYRRRLAELDAHLAAADPDRADRARVERESLLTELRRGTRPGRGSQPLGVTTTERARKAVTARIRDAIKRLGVVLPELASHLDRRVRTGSQCRYDP